MKTASHGYLLLLFAFLLLQSCCKKNDPAPDPYHDFKMPKEMLDYGYFKPGTYWIYQDSISGAIDSVWVYDAYYLIDTLGESNPYDLPQGIYDDFEIKTTSSYFNADYYYWSNSSKVTNDISYPLFREIIKPSLIAETISFRYQYEIGKLYYGYSALNRVDTQSCITFNHELLLMNHTYSEVIAYEQTANYLEQNSHTLFFFSKNFGIIRKEIIDRNENWNLIRYNIIQ